VVSFPVPKHEPGTRFWLGLQDPAALTGDQIVHLSSVAESSADVLQNTVTAADAPERFRRVELAAELLPALLSVLDVREVFNRLSLIAQKALPHDLLLLRVFNEDFSKIMTFARTGGGADLDIALPHSYPAAVTQVWNFDIMDDHQAHPIERDKPPAKMGVRSSLRLPIRFDDRVIGGLAFLSVEPNKYAADDVLVGRRLADHVALALSHHNLAERLAEEARSAEALRARTTNLVAPGVNASLSSCDDRGDCVVVGRIRYRSDADGVSLARQCPRTAEYSRTRGDLVRLRADYRGAPVAAYFDPCRSSGKGGHRGSCPGCSCFAPTFAAAAAIFRG
jgi:GAF domain-containing protein